MSRPLLHRRPAAFTPDTLRPICPRCWSFPDLDWGKGRTAGTRGMRGWGVTTGEPVEVDGQSIPVTVVVHRCSNQLCPTALVVTALLDGRYVPGLVDERRLDDAEAAAYREGHHERSGVWLRPSGEPRTAPAQRELFG